MAFDSNGNFTGATATSLSGAGITTVTGTTSVVVGNVTHYFTNRPLSIQATLSYDATKEVVHIVSGTSNSVTVTGSGNFTIRGGKASASFGNNERLDTTPLALSSSKSGPGCCSGGSITIHGGGRLNLYGVRIDLNSVLDWHNGSGGIIRNSVIFSHNSDTNTRIRCQGATNWDIDGLKLSGIQFDWLTDQVFAKFINFLPTDRGIPIENAIGSIGAQRLWRQLPDSRGSADASMNNWTAQKDVVIQLAEAGTGAIIVPDSANGSGSGGHGGRIYHEFTPTASASSGNKNGKAFVRDTNHSKRKATTSAGSIDMTADQFIVTPISAGVGATTSIMIGMWYRNNSVGDLNSPDGNEILDARGKNDVTAVVANDATRDLFDIYFKGLDYAPSSATNQQLNGLSVTPVGFGLLVDTERDSDTLATINAYTSVDTTQKAYNAMKAWSILDANLETPSSTSFDLTKQSEVLNGGTNEMTLKD